MKMNKIFVIVVLLTLALVSTVSALTVSDVIVNGAEITQDSTISIVRGEDVDIWVQLQEAPGVEVKDVKVKAWIEGYEYGDIEDKTDLFDIHASTAPQINIISKHLQLKLPEDLDATEDYTLNIGVFFQSSESIEYEWAFTLLVSPDRHKLNVYDVMFNPSDKVTAGNSLYSKIRVENLGDKREENVKVSLTIPELGITTSDYIIDLATRDNENALDDEENAGDVELTLKIPQDAKTSVYDAVVKVTYGRGNFEEEKRYNIFVEAKAQDTAVNVAPGTPTTNQDGGHQNGIVTSVISVDTTAQTIEQGGAAVYKIMFANLGSESETFSVELSGIDFGTARVDPAFITVAPDKTGEAYVYVSANKDAQLGTHVVNINIKSNGNDVKSISLAANVVEGEIVNPPVSLKQILEWAFIILFIILIIIGVILVVKKLKSNDSDIEEPATESASYY